MVIWTVTQLLPTAATRPWALSRPLPGAVLTEDLGAV